MRSLDIEGPVATITAGWEERESDDGELDSVMDGRSQNLRLFGRMMDVLEHDQAVAAAALALRDAVDDLAGPTRSASTTPSTRSTRCAAGRAART